MSIIPSFHEIVVVDNPDGSRDVALVCTAGDAPYIVEILLRNLTPAPADLPTAARCECGASGYEPHKKWCGNSTASR